MMGSHEPLRAIFRNPASTDLFYGVDNLCESVLREIANSDGHGDHIANLLSKIDTDVSVFRFPNPFYGEIGLQTDRGLISYRAVQAIYQAIAIKKLLPENGGVLEIGPGMGRTVLHCHQIGITNYTTVDLPMGIVAQACFLGATIGPDAIWFTTDQSSPKGKIRILSQSDLAIANERFDLILNVDSIIETGVVESTRYARWIKQHCDTFLSINRNSPRMSLVRLLLGRSKSRAFPLWPGYIEDVFRFVSV
jgi:hypothetical protein